MFSNNIIVKLFDLRSQSIILNSNLPNHYIPVHKTDYQTMPTHSFTFKKVHYKKSLLWKYDRWWQNDSAIACICITWRLGADARLFQLISSIGVTITRCVGGQYAFSIGTSEPSQCGGLHGTVSFPLSFCQAEPEPHRKYTGLAPGQARPGLIMRSLRVPPIITLRTVSPHVIYVHLHSFTVCDISGTQWKNNRAAT